LDGVWLSLSAGRFFTDNDMVKLKFLVVFLFFPLLLPAQDVLRGAVKIELMPIYGAYVDAEYPLEKETAYRRALEEAALFFSAQIYGWSFHYDVGERARGIEEIFELTPLGEIRWGDPGLSVTNAHFENRDFRFTSLQLADVLTVWLDYRPTPAQAGRIEMWKKGYTRTAQAVGYGPLGGPADNSDWITIKKSTLEDSARAAVRAMLQGSERNRPRQATGFICLQTFPSYWMDAGRWAAQARFRVEVTDIVPFAAY